MTDQPWWHEDEVPPNPRTGEGTGSAAEEASRLFMAMRDRLLSDPATIRAGLKIMESFSHLNGATGGATPGNAPECAYCPFCVAIRRAQGISPEAVERLTGAAMEFAETVRQVVGQPDETDPDGVRHVPLDEDFEGWPEPVDIDGEEPPD